MPRYIEDIVRNHQVARERRAAGKPIWDKTINVREIIARDQSNESEEHAAAVANEIAALVKSKVPAEWLDWTHDDADNALIEVVESMADLRADSFADDPSYSALEELNNRLEELYDWADYKRIWLG